MGANGYVSRRQNDTTGYLFKGAHGDILSIYTSTSNKVDDYTYDAWGEVRTKNETSAFANNPLRYYGQYYDYESNMTYLRARYYDSSIRRFITEDKHWNVDNMIYGDNDTQNNNILTFMSSKTSTYYNKYLPNNLCILQSNNIYVYSLNNPILYFDSSGLAVTAYGIVASIGVGGVGYEGMYLWSTDDKGNFALLAVNGYYTSVGASLGVIGMYFPDMPSVDCMYGYGFGISGSLNGWGLE